MNYAEEQMKHAEEIKRSFDKIEDIFWKDRKAKETDGCVKYTVDYNDIHRSIKQPEEFDTKIDEKAEDVVNHPSHYASSCSIECIDAMECMFGSDKLISFCLMNAFKYIWRFKNKNGSEDLKKARWYLSKATKTLENCKLHEGVDYEFEEFACEMRIRLEKLLEKYS